MYISIIAIAALILTLVGMSSSSSLAFASIVYYEDESEKEEECKEESVYDYLCNGGGGGVNGLPFCDEYNATELDYFLILQKKAVMIEQPILYPSAKNLMT